MILSYMTWLHLWERTADKVTAFIYVLTHSLYILYQWSVATFTEGKQRWFSPSSPQNAQTNKNAFLHYLPIRQDKLNLNKTYHLYCLSALHGHHNNIIILNHHSCNMIWLLNTWCVKVHLVILFCIICWLYKSMLIRIQLFVIFTT